MTFLKGILAVVAGVAFVLITHSATDLILEGLGIFSPPSQGFFITWMVVTATVYRTAWTIAAGYVTALLAPTPKVGWVISLSIVVFTLSMVGIAINLKYKLSPNWYPIALTLLAIPSTWLGGKLREWQDRRRALP